MANPSPATEYQCFIAQSVATTYVDLLNTTTVNKINVLTKQIAEDMALEIELQMQKMRSIKSLLEVRIREAKHEEDRKRESTIDAAWDKLQRTRAATAVNLSPMTPRGAN